MNALRSNRALRSPDGWMACGFALASAFVPTVNAQWTAKVLHPEGMQRSEVTGVWGMQQAGRVDKDINTRYAALWNGTAGSWTNLNPTGSIDSGAYAASGGQQVGWAWMNGENHASLWTGTAESWVNLTPPGGVSSIAYGVSGGQQVGSAVIAGGMRASLWSGTANSWVDLSGNAYSSAYATADGQQVGFKFVDGPWGAKAFAALWSGTADSWVNLGANFEGESQALGVSMGQQVGYISMVRRRAALWTGTADSFIDLTPPGAVEATANAVFNQVQVGHATFGSVFGPQKAVAWFGTAQSFEDLHSSLPPDFTHSSARSVWSDGVNIYAGGWATNETTNRLEAVLWTRPIPAPSSVSLLIASGLCLRSRRSMRFKSVPPFPNAPATRSIPSQETPPQTAQHPAASQ